MLKKIFFESIRVKEENEWKNSNHSVAESMAYVDGIKAVLDAIDPKMFAEYSAYAEEQAILNSIYEEVYR
jgi:prophage DNA circulation protein